MKIPLLLVLSFLPMQSFAQEAFPVDKGSLIIGGTAGFSGTTSNLTDRRTQINFRPAQSSHAGHFELFETKQPDDVPYFGVDVLNLSSDDPSLSRLIFDLTFVNEALQFIKIKKKKFRADYEAFAMIMDMSGTEVDSRRWKGFVTAPDFDETNSVDILHSTPVSFDLPPDSYKFRFELKDLETRQAGLREGSCTLRDFSGSEMIVSDVFLIDSHTFEWDTQISTATRLISPPPELGRYAYFEIYHVPESNNIEIAYEILGPDEKTVQSGEHVLASAGNVTRDYIPLRNFRPVRGKYRFGASIQSNKKLVKIDQPLNLPDIKPPPYKNLDEAIEHLVYIANSSELKRLKSLDGDERVKAFEEFWQKRDPTSQTRENEYFLEYYRRVTYVNENFSGIRLGWKTDMGLVYIMLGPPESVKIIPEDFDDLWGKPRVVWWYYFLDYPLFFAWRVDEYRLARRNLANILGGEMRF